MEGPRFVRYFGPVLQALETLGGSGRPSEVRTMIAQRLLVPEQELLEALPSGGQSRFDNQVAWARFYLVKAGYIDASRRGVWSLTEKGRSGLGMTHREALQWFKEVHATFATPEEVAVSEETVTPAEEPLAPAESAPTTNYRQQLSDTLHTLSPAGFERFCQRLLRESGFEQVTITGRSGDGGIDGIGILQVSPLVSFKVLFQCKRYTSAVGSAQVRDFRGAMMGRADKGIILTTGTFTADAKREAIRDGVPPLELVDGEKLVDMCEALELGLRPKTTFEFDPTFFDEFRQ